MLSSPQLSSSYSLLYYISTLHGISVMIISTALMHGILSPLLTLFLLSVHSTLLVMNINNALLQGFLLSSLSSPLSSSPLLVRRFLLMMCWLLCLSHFFSFSTLSHRSSSWGSGISSSLFFSFSFIFLFLLLLFILVISADRTPSFVKNNYVKIATDLMRKLLDDKLTAHNFLNLGVSLSNIASFAQCMLPSSHSSLTHLSPSLTLPLLSSLTLCR